MEHAEELVKKKSEHDSLFLNGSSWTRTYT